MKQIKIITMLTLFFSFQYTYCMNKKSWSKLTEYTKLAYLNDKIKKEQNIQNARKKKYCNQHDFDDTHPAQTNFRYDINHELR